jgi:hypothetical protein
VVSFLERENKGRERYVIMNKWIKKRIESKEGNLRDSKFKLKEG